MHDGDGIHLYPIHRPTRRVRIGLFWLPSSCSPPILERVLLFSTMGKDSVLLISRCNSKVLAPTLSRWPSRRRLPRPASGPCGSQKRATANFRTRWQRIYAHWAGYRFLSAELKRTASSTDPDRRSGALLAHWFNAGPRRPRAHPTMERADANPGPCPRCREVDERRQWMHEVSSGKRSRGVEPLTS